jgi:asparagine synthetase A
MTTESNYPSKFKYKQSHFEGTHTSYTWQTSNPDDKIIGETKSFYVIDWNWSKTPKKVKKENIEIVKD